MNAETSFIGRERRECEEQTEVDHVAGKYDGRDDRLREHPRLA